MSLRKPLVIVSGQIQQLQSGDSIEVAYDILELENNTGGAVTILICSPVYCSGAGTIKGAKADAASSAKTLGLVREPTEIADTATGAVITDGILTATTAEWDAIAGTTGGLTANAPYYLSAGTAGYLTETAPTTVGQYVVRVGVAISTTELEISIQPPILL